MKKIMKVTVVLLVLFCSVNLLGGWGPCHICGASCPQYQKDPYNEGVCGRGNCGHVYDDHSTSNKTSAAVSFNGYQYHTPPIIEKEEWYETKWGMGIIAFIIIGIIGACYEKFIQ